MPARALIEMATAQSPIGDGVPMAVEDKWFDAQKLQQARGQSDLSRERLVYMSPDDFLTVAMQIDLPEPGKMKTVRSLVQKNIPFRDVPYLAFDHDGKGTAIVVSHEGRHRAMVLRGRGVKKMPVVLWSRASADGSAIRWGQIACRILLLIHEWLLQRFFSFDMACSLSWHRMRLLQRLFSQ